MGDISFREVIIWFGPDQNLTNTEISGNGDYYMQYEQEATTNNPRSRCQLNNGKQGLLHCNPSTWWLPIGNWETNVNVAYSLALGTSITEVERESVPW